MSDPLRYYFDHNMWGAVAEGLRLRGFDILTAEEAGRKEDDDPDHLTFAAAEGRVTVTFDTDFQKWHNSGMSHAGIVWCRFGKYTVGQMVELLEILGRTVTLEQMRDRLEYL